MFLDLGAAVVDHSKRHGNGAQVPRLAGPAVWIAMLMFAVGLVVKAGGSSLEHGIPMNVLLEKTGNAGISGAPESF